MSRYDIILGRESVQGPERFLSDGTVFVPFDRTVTGPMRYVSLDIQCRHCGKWFDHTRLTNELLNMGSHLHKVEKICPCCGFRDCCEIEYERVSDV
jgi:hypothetical protein